MTLFVIIYADIFADYFHCRCRRFLHDAFTMPLPLAAAADITDDIFAMLLSLFFAAADVYFR